MRTSTLPRFFGATFQSVCVAIVTLVLSNGSAAAICVGDCDANGDVTIDEILIGANQALGAMPIAACGVFDGDGDTVVDVAEIITAVNNALFGCPAEADVAQSSLAREAPAVGAAVLAQAVAGNRAFAWDLYARLRSGSPGNLFFSPYSISAALAMLYGGAAGQTAQQMADALHFSLPQGELHAAFNALDLELAQRAHGRQGADGKGFRLNISNAIWGQRGYRFLPGYLDVLAANYGAGMRLVDFANDAESARELINDLVSQQTEQRIQNLLAPEHVTALTRLILTNAIYFNAAWAHPFLPLRTTSEPFYRLDESTVDVAMMHQVETLGYRRYDEFEAVDLPYDGDQLSMLIVLPDSGRFAALEARLNAALYDEIATHLSPTYVALAMPKFTFTNEYPLAPALQALGMTDAFSAGAADLSGIDGSRELFVQSVVHKAFIKVNEAGTEAAAATGVGVGVTSVPPPPLPLRLDRPFIFAIRDRPTGAILFVGRIVRPQ